MKKHIKHAAIPIARIGEFHRNEFAILGTPCSEIKKLSYALIKELNAWNIGYVDADHKSADEPTANENTALYYGGGSEYIDKINFHRHDQNRSLNKFDFQQKFIAEDLVFVNGNHFLAKKQIVVIDSKKPLDKKLDRLTDVALILFQKDEPSVPDFLKEFLPSIESIPTFLISDTVKIAAFISSQLIQPQLKGLVLAGGKSTRMSTDKGKLNYHGKQQRLYMQELLSEYTSDSFVSIRNDQTHEFDSNIKTVSDVFEGLGPYGGILSAFQNDPNSAWLVTACDQPYLTRQAIELLVKRRNPSKFATAFYNSETDFPEPLITIWEPRAYSRLLYFLSLGYSCPRKVLINSEIELVKLEDETVLKNVNTPEEKEAYETNLAQLK